MTNYNDAIDRALDRLTLAEAPRRSILTDLVAEVRAKFADQKRAIGEERRAEWIRAERAEARLAAVVEACERIAAAGAQDSTWMGVVRADHILAIARGEGGERASPDATTVASYRGGEDYGSVEPEDPTPATPDAETKPQQSPASDGDLDEIVRDAIERYREFQPDMKERRFQEIAYMVARRARETDPKLAAVRAWRVRWAALLAGHRAQIELDAILDGEKGNDDLMNAQDTINKIREYILDEEYTVTGPGGERKCVDTEGLWEIINEGKSKIMHCGFCKIDFDIEINKNCCEREDGIWACSRVCWDALTINDLEKEVEELRKGKEKNLDLITQLSSQLVAARIATDKWGNSYDARRHRADIRRILDKGV